jgi:hypothetical protein
MEGGPVGEVSCSSCVSEDIFDGRSEDFGFAKCVLQFSLYNRGNAALCYWVMVLAGPRDGLDNFNSFR